MKLIKKERLGLKIKRLHDKPLTPCDRLLENKNLSQAAKNELRSTRAKLNPIELKKELEEKLRKTFALQKTFFANKANARS